MKINRAAACICINRVTTIEPPVEARSIMSIEQSIVSVRVYVLQLFAAALYLVYMFPFDNLFNLDAHLFAVHHFDFWLSGS
jgi:hypothetical protein